METLVANEIFSEKGLNLDLSIILPAYNEEENIEEVINKTAKFLKQYNGIYEILVVNDGSIDNVS